MKIEEVIEFYDDVNEKIKKANKYLYDLLGKEYETKLRILDPRVNHYEFYGEVTEDDYKKIAEIYPNVTKAVKDDGTLGALKVSSKIGFTIYNVNSEEKDDLIKEHDDAYSKALEENKGTIY